MAGSAYLMMINQDKHAFVNFALWSLFTIAHVAVYFLGRRFKDKFVPMIVSLYIAQQFLVVARVELMAN